MISHIGKSYDAVVIGAGPSGAVAAAILANKGYKTLILERETFPRFSIGESLLPQCMEYLDEAGMLPAVEAAGFQKKNGAVFQRRGQYTSFEFAEQFSPGWSQTYQVRRAEFDHILADQAAAMGVDVRYQHEITAVELGAQTSTLACRCPDGSEVSISGRFLLDASGFGRVLPRLLHLEKPSDFPVRSSLFTHLEDGITDQSFDREKILISVHSQHSEVWYWLIPFSDGRSSIGVVAHPEFVDRFEGEPLSRLQAIVDQDSALAGLLAKANWDTPTRQITGYAARAEPLATERYTLLGNAAEFLDPVFSSGVTIALRSASKAAALLDRQFRGESVDWQRQYADPLVKGVNTFRAFVDAWYDGRLQDIVFHQGQSNDIRRMICSILAGYAWDENNPYVRNPHQRLDTLARYCRQ